MAANLLPGFFCWGCLLVSMGNPHTRANCSYHQKKNNQERVSEAATFQLQVEVKPPVKGEELLPVWLCLPWDAMAST